MAVFKGENHTLQGNGTSHQKSLLGFLTRVQHKRVTTHFPLEQPIFRRSCFSHLTEAPTAGKTCLTLQKRAPFCSQNLDQALIGITSSGTFSEHSQLSQGDRQPCLHQTSGGLDFLLHAFMRISYQKTQWGLVTILQPSHLTQPSDILGWLLLPLQLLVSIRLSLTSHL